MSVYQVNTPAPKRNSYSRRHRLTRQNELEKIKRAGKRLKIGHLEARVAMSLLSYCRVGVIVAKYGHSVVERNRLRRQLRELARVVLIPSLSGLDLVIRALPSAYGTDFQVLTEEIMRIRIELMTESPAT